MRLASARAALSRRTAAHYFSMKSATCPMRPKQGYSVLAEGEFFRVGGATAIKTDVRVIAATHQDLIHCRRGLIPRGPVSPAQRYRHKCAKTRRAPRRHPTIAQSLLTKAASELGVPTKEPHQSETTSLSWRGPETFASSKIPLKAHSNGAGNTLDERSATRIGVDHDQGSQPEGSWEKQLCRFWSGQDYWPVKPMCSSTQCQIESIMMSAALLQRAKKRSG